jgi:hypothetical protein
VTREAYDAVVLDIMLPQRSGYAVIAATSLAQQQRSLADPATGHRPRPWPPGTHRSGHRTSAPVGPVTLRDGSTLPPPNDQPVR